MGEKDLYDYWSDTYKVHSLDWSQEKAAAVLREWQASFTAEVARIVAEQKLQRKYDVSAYSSSQLDEIMEDFSEFRIPDLMLGLLAVVSPSSSATSTFIPYKIIFAPFSSSTPASRFTAGTASCALSRRWASPASSSWASASPRASGCAPSSG